MGVKLFRTPETLMRPVFQMGSGDVFSTAKLRKGFDELRKLYGKFGYIDFVAEPSIEPVPNTDKIDLTLNFDEGKQFFVRRIDFSGNTTTRDKVIRREMLLDEGDIYNTRLMEVSLLRLNQLGYFEVLKMSSTWQCYFPVLRFSILLISPAASTEGPPRLPTDGSFNTTRPCARSTERT